jgi:hypothetical protein
VSCKCPICRDNPEPYIRVCWRCGQFHNWRVYGDGEAVCGNCGAVHGPRVSRNFGDVRGTFADKSNCYQPVAAEGGGK